VSGAGRPPNIVDQSGEEMTYKVSEKVELVCVAVGHPPPSWAYHFSAAYSLTGVKINADLYSAS